MHCTGQTSTQARSFTSMHASVMIARPAMTTPQSKCLRPLIIAPDGSRLQKLQCAHGEIGTYALPDPAIGDSRRSLLRLPDPNDVVGEPYGEDSRWRGLGEELS